MVMKINIKTGGLTMKGKRCDRCGKFYTENFNKYENYNTPIEQVGLLAENEMCLCYYDLCDCCVFELMEFLNEKGDNNA